MFKEGDWIIHNREIAQVVHVDGERITELTSGMFSTSGHDLDCRPLTPTNKVIMEGINYYFDKMDKLPGSRTLNWPDINRYFEELIINAIDDIHSGSAKNAEKQYTQAGRFYNEVKEKLDNLNTKIDGVRLVR